jgi:hypothetical protein
MKELRTEIEIDASPETVWQILTDLAHYREWNPAYHAAGQMQLGGKVDVILGPESKGMTLHCVVIKVDPNRELRWKYHVIAPALFSGDHSMWIEPLGERRVRFINREIFSGLLVPLQARDIDNISRRDFEAMDQALKKRAESI